MLQGVEAATDAEPVLAMSAAPDAPKRGDAELHKFAVLV
jgi:hypothetical protein